ncbi:MAG: hypothetical protein AMJ69_10620 [Gammaproteobacteria bacterium SG8_47]|nr:MAG: hypothetical protein AMJ69_10620 [Gammaproteobacteria bacterium SG8_47]
MTSTAPASVLTSLVNGVAQPSVSVLDRGLHYGDGLFETIAVAQGEAVLWDRHLARLRAGCERLGFVCPSPGTLRSETILLCAGHRRAVLKWIITRGGAGRGYRPSSDALPNRIGLIYAWPEHPPECWSHGVKLALCSVALSAQPALAGVKHLGRIEQVLAAAECEALGAHEGVMLDLEGRVVEGSMSNLFLVKDGRLRTPALTSCGIAGIMRQFVIDRAEGLGVAGVDICHLDVEALRTADELFVTNSVIGLWPVREFDGRHFGRPGPVSRQFLEVIRDELTM